LGVWTSLGVAHGLEALQDSRHAAHVGREGAATGAVGRP